MLSIGSESIYKAIFENSLDMMCIAKLAEAKFIEVNPAFSRILGYTSDELCQKPFLEYVHPDDVDETIREINYIISSGRTSLQFRNRYRHSEGHYRWLEWNSKILNEEDLVVATAYDITDKVNRQNALMEENRQSRELAFLIQALPHIIWTADQEGNINFCNDYGLKFLGAELEAIEGASWVQFIHPEDAPLVVEKWLLCVNQKRRFENEQRIFNSSTNEWEWFQVIGKPLFGENGEIIKWYGISINIESLKQVESSLRDAKDKAESANSAKSEFLAVMSHELKSPLNPIKGLSMLMLESAQSAEARDFLKIIIDSANDMELLINQILEYSKIHQSTTQLQLSEFHLMDLVERILHRFDGSWNNNIIELAACTAAGWKPVPKESLFIGDRMLLTQVVSNLMDNASKYTKEGRITIRTGCKDTGDTTLLRIEVEDTGIGIPEIKIATIFEPFSQVDSSQARAYEGVGLGLAITRKIVDILNGNIGVESEVGRGSLFWVEIPVEGS